MTTIDKDSVREAYDSVRDDKNEATWLVLRYEGNQIVVASSGSDFNDFLLNFKGLFDFFFLRSRFNDY